MLALGVNGPGSRSPWVEWLCIREENHTHENNDGRTEFEYLASGSHTRKRRGHIFQLLNSEKGPVQFDDEHPTDEVLNPFAGEINRPDHKE